MKENYFKRLKKKVSIKKLDDKQPVKLWLFVLIFNLIGFLGFYLIRNM